jgi:hypothetical protein
MIRPPNRSSQWSRMWGGVPVTPYTGLAPLRSRPGYNHVRGLCARVLGRSLFAPAWAAGRTMTLEQAIEYALAAETGRETSNP